MVLGAETIFHVHYSIANVLAIEVQFYWYECRKRVPLKHDQIMNDATSGQIGEEPRSTAVSEANEDSHIKAARRLSREV